MRSAPVMGRVARAGHPPGRGFGRMRPNRGGAV